MSKKPKTTAPEDLVAPDKADVRAFAQELDRLIKRDTKLGLAVSGGPDSVAMLLLAAAARPGLIEVATVDHSLRDGSAAEAQWVAGLCEKLGVPHEILTIDWAEKPTTGIQEQCRMRRYQALGEWGQKHKLEAIAMAHHADDQAETLLMRLSRGAGVQGLSGMRRYRAGQGGTAAIVRPLLGFSHDRLVGICEAAGVKPIHDPTNDDPAFERTRVRKMLDETDWLDPQQLSRAAANLQAADMALGWAAQQEWQRRVTEVNSEHIAVDHVGLPDELARRIVRDVIVKLRSEGGGWDLRGRELDTVMATLRSGRPVTLGGVMCHHGPAWRFQPAKPRRPVGAAKEDASAS